MSNEITATSRTKINNHESNMQMARIAAGLKPPARRKYVVPFETEALEADMQAAKAAGTIDEFSLLDLIYLPNGKKLRDSTGDEVTGYVKLERLFDAQRALSKLINAELVELAAKGQA